jgi:hypothetical protein
MPDQIMGRSDNGIPADCKSAAFGHWGFESLSPHHKWTYLLTVRKTDSQSVNRSSILRVFTNLQNILALFLAIVYNEKYDDKLMFPASTTATLE